MRMEEYDPLCRPLKGAEEEREEEEEVTFSYAHALFIWKDILL